MRGTLTATGAVLLLALIYAVSCWVRPFRDCWVCGGQGHHRSPHNRKLSRPCLWCQRTGKRLRFGRRLWNWWRRLQREGTA